MSNNKQSSVEWYIIERHNIEIQSRLGEISPIEYDAKLIKIEEKAKAMHKEEMVDFGNDLLAQNDTNYIGLPNLAEQYYNETFGGNNEQ